MTAANFKEVIARSPSVFAIGVAGDSGSGKTTFTRAIREIFGSDLVATITLDDYHLLDREARRATGITPLALEANNLTLLEDHLALLKQGEAIEKPVYDHRTGTFQDPVSFPPPKILILEGLHTLATPRLRELLDFTLFVDPADGVKKCWKIRRDMERRGYRRAEVLEEIERRRPDYEAFVAPQKAFAEAVITIGFSSFEKGCGTADNLYRVTLDQGTPEKSSRNGSLFIDLFPLLALPERNFSLDFRAEEREGGRRGLLTFDGEVRYDVIRTLEKSVEKQTGVHPVSIFRGRSYVTATEIVELILSWRIIHRRLWIEYG